MERNKLTNVGTEGHVDWADGITKDQYESLRKVAETCCAHKNYIVEQQMMGKELDVDDEGLYTLETAFMFLYRKFVKPVKSKVN